LQVELAAVLLKEAVVEQEEWYKDLPDLPPQTTLLVLEAVVVKEARALEVQGLVSVLPEGAEVPQPTVNTRLHREDQAVVVLDNSIIPEQLEHLGKATLAELVEMIVATTQVAAVVVRVS
jgi:hypothetical protein